MDAQEIIRTIAEAKKKTPVKLLSLIHIYGGRLGQIEIQFRDGVQFPAEIREHRMHKDAPFFVSYPYYTRGKPG